MTIPSTTRRAGPFYGPMASGAQIPFSFKVFAATDIAVTIADANGVETAGVLNSTYLVTLNADQTTSPGGYVQYAAGGVVAALPTGYTVAINGAREYSQDTQLTQGSNFNPISVERAFDVLTILVQQLKDAYDRTAKITVLSPDGTNTTLPVPSANAVIGWNADGTALQNYEPNSVDLSVATLTADLASQANASKAAGQIGFDPALNYVAGTIGWWDRHAGVSLLRYMPITKLAAIVAGTNTDDLTTYVQAALDAALTSGFELNGHGYTYKCNSPLTWRRSSSGHTKRMQLVCAVFDFSGITGTATAFTVGATGTSFFIEDGHVVLRDLTLLGNETADPRDTANTNTVTGLALTYAGGVTLDGIRCFGFYKSYYSLWAFPVKATNCNFRRSWIGAHFDEVSNLQEWDGLTLPNCRYGILIRSESTALDSGKTNTLTFTRPWIEGTCVGMVIDTDAGVGGSGQIRHRGIKVVAPYLSSPAGSVNPSDFFRIGTRWTLANPTTRGANCTEFVSDVELDLMGGLVNPSTGVFTSSQALVAFDSSNARCRNFQLNGILTGVRLDADAIVNRPLVGWARTSGYPGVSDGLVEEVWWDTTGIVRRLWPNGGMTVGAKATQGTVSEVGVELDPLGIFYATRDGGQAFDFNRLNSDGTMGTFRRSGTAVGSIGVTTTATTYNISSARWLKQDITPADQAKAVMSVLNWPLREFSFKATPTVRQFGVIADEMLAHKPDAVWTDEEGRAAGFDYTKLIPELAVAVQYLLQKDQNRG